MPVSYYEHLKNLFFLIIHIFLHIGRMSNRVLKSYRSADHTGHFVPAQAQAQKLLLA